MKYLFEEWDLEIFYSKFMEDNIGSKKTMEKFIGESDTLVTSIYDGIMEYRYWVDVKKLNNENSIKLK